MKRNIKDLKPNEAIQINTKKELKAISKLLDKNNLYNPIPEAIEMIGLPIIISPLGSTKWGSVGFVLTTNNEIHPASDFIRKPKKSRLDKIEERLKALEKGLPSTVTYSEDGKVSIRISEQDMPQPKLINYGGVETVLTELPEKWKIERNEENFDTVNDWYSKEFGIPHSAKKGTIYHPQGHLKTEYTEITTEQFKKWVLGDDEFKTERWYIHPKTKALLFVPKNMKCYGFYENIEWIEINMSNITFDKWQPATEQEVSDALIAEAKRRGFKDGANFKDLHCGTESKVFQVFYCSNSEDLRSDKFGGFCIFYKGKWAEIVSQPQTEIDWSKAGQLVISDDIVIETTGLHSSDAFSGVVVLGNNRYKRGHAINRWNKSKFKPYTGKL